MEPPEKLAFAMERSAPIGVRGSRFILGRGGCSLGSIPVTSARAGALALICVLGKHMQWMYGMTENVSNLFIQMPIYPAICPNPDPAQ